MKRIIIYILTICSLNAFSQEDKKKQLKTLEQAKDLVYEANQLAASDNYISAEMEYRKAISKEPNMAVGNYNLANSYYEKGNFDEAFYRLQQATKVAKTKEEKHRAYHNIGNVLMQNKKCKEAVEAFKNALRNNPSDEETRYNFALAKQCAEEQQKQDDQQDENKDQDDKKEDPKENEDENKEDQNDKGDQDKKEGEDEKDDKGDPKDEKDKDGNQKEEEQNKKKPQPKPGQLSPQQIKNLLEAMNNQEEKVQEKINAEKTKGVKVRSEKDW